MTEKRRMQDKIVTHVHSFLLLYRDQSAITNLINLILTIIFLRRSKKFIEEKSSKFLSSKQAFQILPNYPRPFLYYLSSVQHGAPSFPNFPGIAWSVTIFLFVRCREMLFQISSENILGTYMRECTDLPSHARK